MVTMRSPGSINWDIAFSSVVLPEPVPPEIRMLRRLRAAIFRTVAMACEMLFCRAITSSVMPFLENLRMEIEGPSIASGGMMMLTRLRSEEHTSELQSLMRISYAVFCLQKKKEYQIYEHDIYII